MVRLGKRADARKSIHPTAHELFAPNVYWMTAAMIVSAALSHLLIRRQIGGVGGLLFIVHLSFAMAFCITLGLMRLNPGSIRPKLHKRIGYGVLMPSFMGMALTGLVLLILM